ncbi:MAG: adenylate/guanylate cyclase domain-containing protein [Alphaproteobacteria bacterium]|jgi:adenylate cyclase|nr:adenylate/guanylate cyclase domain-containing protein [Alphaproteobacteria bacterium]
MAETDQGQAEEPHALRITLRAKILLLVLCLVIILSAAAAQALYRAQLIEAELRVLAEIFVPLNDHFGRLALLSVERDLTFRHLLAVADGHEDSDPVALERDLTAEVTKIRHALAEVDRLLERAAARRLSDESARVIDTVSEAVAELAEEAAEYDDASAIVRRSLAEKTPLGPHATRLIGHGHDLESSLNSSMRGLVALTETATRSAGKHQRRAHYLGAVIVVLALALAVWLSVLLSAGITRPLGRLVRGATEVAGGNLEVTVEKSTRDEVGDLTGAFNNMVSGLRLKERIENTFGRYMDPRIVRELVDRPTSVTHTERREKSVAFVDLAGFTSLTESLSATELLAFLNAYFQAMAAPIAARNGVVDKFIGDAVMSYYGPPFTSAEAHAAEACLVALDQVAALAELRRSFAGLPSFDIRVGIATGEVVVGSIGAEFLQSYTVVGDQVNVASRLESLSKSFGTRILITGRTRELAAAAIEAREVTRVAVRGRSGETSVYEVMAPGGGLTEDQTALVARYSEGLALYRASEWEAAEAAFHRCLEIEPEDGPAAAMIRFCNDAEAYP